MTRVRILQSYFETDQHGVSQQVFSAGQLCELNPASQRQIERRNGELVEESVPVPARAPAPAETGSPDAGVRVRQRGRPMDQ